METIWEESIKMPGFSRLEGDLRTDVLIIGGGLAGLLCANRLHRAGVDCVLIEENRIMSGVSGRTTAKLTCQHGLIYSKLLKKLGRERARLYYDANLQALEDLRQLAEDCDYQTQGNFIYATEDLRKLQEEWNAYEQLGIPACWKDRVDLPFPVEGAIGFTGQGQFHPMKLAAQVAKNLKIYEDTKAIEFVGNRVLTTKGAIRAEKIIVATHFPLLNKHGAYFLKLYQQRSYVIALENAGQVDGMYLDCKDNGLSVRSAGKYLLLGGGGHRTGKQGLGWRLPETMAQKYYPQGRVAARWATQDCMPLDGMPYIGQYSKATPNLFVATGFQKWGMTTSMAAATILTDLVQGKENPYAGLFSPSRSILHKQLVCNGIESVANLICPTKPRCPHLGCALRWNKEERSWDCPCHGSRFDEYGKKLNNPATDDLK